MKKTPLRSRSAPLRSREPARGKPIKRKKRTASEFRRIYGSKERVAWVKNQACIACVAEGAVWIWTGVCENAHTETDGMGRKAGYETIVPLCRWHHRDFDQHRPPFNDPAIREQAKRVASEVEAAWQSHLRQTGRARSEETDHG